MGPRVSVIVPVYNPGSDIDDCIASLLGQSLPRSDYEVIFVDDGSTDGTPARLDALAAEHPNVRAEHIPNSGWPGRPRNVGLELARGEYVFFVDNDDWLGREALERLLTAAAEGDADIVVGKVVGHGKPVARSLFLRTRHGRTIRSLWLLGLLSPHKLFRRGLLDDHGIRFPEGRRRLEDHAFVVPAYFAAERISVLADYPCYHWVRREDAGASFGAFDPVGYFDDLREILDIVDARTEPGDLRLRMYAHWYRGKLLRRVGGSAFLEREPDYRRAMYEEIRRTALERFPEAVDDHLSFKLRARSRLLRDGRYEALHAMAAAEADRHGIATVMRLRDDSLPRRLRLVVEASLAGPDGPLRFTRHGDRLVWQAPPAVREALPAELLDATEALSQGSLDLLVVSEADGAEYVVETEPELRLEPVGGDAVTPVVSADVRLQPSRTAAGGPLAPGDWRLGLAVNVAGFNADVDLLFPGRRSSRLGLRVRPGGEVEVRGGGLRRDLARRAPWLARALRTGPEAAVGRRARRE